jgi:OPA family sugar phosphate sensor protein UhpC-like MFS transporter
MIGRAKRIATGAFDWYRTGPDAPVLTDAGEIARIYERRRRAVFWSLVFGYSFFYVCRLTLSVVKKPMIDGGILNADQMGKIGSALFLAYAFGKLINGFLGDRSNIRRFVSTGLLGSAVIVVLFGFTRTFWVFLILWGLNGWFQSMGAAPCGASISQWFSNRERGTRYGVWSTAHSIGEGATFAVTAVIVAAYGWQWGFWAAGGVSILVALLMFRTLADRPRTYGLPAVADYKNDHTEETRGTAISVGRAQLEVIKNPFVWILGLSCTAMYIGRYGVNSWGVLYLQEAKGYSLVTAGFLLFLAKILETAGALSSGFVSDRFFHARRNVVTLLYGLMQILGFLILLAAPTTYRCGLDRSLMDQLREGKAGDAVRTALEQHGVAVGPAARVMSGKTGDNATWLIGYDAWYLGWKGYRVEDTGTELAVFAKYHPLHLVGFAFFGFGLGGLLVFLGGLIAIDICSKRASGAAMGLVGMFSYLGASVQDWVSGGLIEAGKMTVHGQPVHDFNPAFGFWLGAAVFAVALSCTLWNVKARD